MERGRTGGQREDRWTEGGQVDRGRTGGQREDRWTEGGQVDRGRTGGQREGRWRELEVEHLLKVASKPKALYSCCLCRHQCMQC